MFIRITPYLVVPIMVPVSWVLITNDSGMSVLLGLVGIGVVGCLLNLSRTYEIVQRRRIWVIVILLVLPTIFWTFFELTGSAFNLFTLRNIDKNFLGFELTTTFFQVVNPLIHCCFCTIALIVVD